MLRSFRRCLAPSAATARWHAAARSLDSPTSPVNCVCDDVVAGLFVVCLISICIRLWRARLSTDSSREHAAPHICTLPPHPASLQRRYIEDVVIKARCGTCALAVHIAARPADGGGCVRATSSAPFVPTKDACGVRLGMFMSKHRHTHTQTHLPWRGWKGINSSRYYRVQSQTACGCAVLAQNNKK